jgi:hypothetical protein
MLTKRDQIFYDSVLESRVSIMLATKLGELEAWPESEDTGGQAGRPSG